MNELESLALILNTLPIDAQARMSYDSLAGGLVWSDEIPVWDFNGLRDGQFPRGHGEFRALLQFRGSVILGHPDSRSQQIWETAAQLCPNWPGLLPARRDAGLANELKRRSAKAFRSWEEANTVFEQQQQAGEKKAIA